MRGQKNRNGGPEKGVKNESAKSHFRIETIENRLQNIKHLFESQNSAIPSLFNLIRDAIENIKMVTTFPLFLLNTNKQYI